MLPRRRNGAGTLLLFLARRLAIFLFVGVNHLQSLYRQVNRHFHLNPRFRFGSEKDSLAERGEFELPVPISEQPDDNMMSGPRRQTRCWGSPVAQTPGRRSATFEGDCLRSQVWTLNVGKDTGTDQ